MSGLGSRSSPAVLTATVSAALFADSLLYSAVVPVLPTYASQHGASDAAVGVLFASYAVALLVATPPFAAFSDRYGRRLPLILGMAGVTAATLGFAVADSYPSLLAARSLQGAAAAAVWTSGVALLADQIEPGRLGAAMGTAMASMSAGLLLGPPAAGFLVELGGFRLPFLTAAVVTGVAALTQLIPRPVAATRTTSRGLRDLVGRPLAQTAAAVMLAAAALSLLEPTLPLDLVRRFGSGPAMIGILFGLATLAHLIAAPPVGYLSDRTSRVRLMVLGLAAMGAVLPGIAVASSVGGVGLVLVGFAVAYSFVLVPALPELAAVVRAANRTSYAAAYAVFNLSYAVGMVAGPIAGTVALNRWGSFPVLLTVGGLLISAAVALQLSICRRSTTAAIHLAHTDSLT